MTAGGTDYERELLAQATRQTRALEQIQNLLWFLIGLGLLGAVLWAVTAL